MIIIKYLKGNIYKTTAVVLLILIAIFFAQQLIVAFNQVRYGNIPPSFVVKFIAYNMPSLMQYFLALALFMGIILSFMRLYHNQELVVMYACGLSSKQVFSSFFSLTLAVFVFSLFNNLWLSPNLLLANRAQIQFFKTNPTFSLVKPGTFNNFPNTNYILFIDQINNNEASNLFIIDYQDKNNLQIIISNKGLITVEDGIRKIELHNGFLFSKDLSKVDFTTSEQVLTSLNNINQNELIDKLTDSFKQEVLNTSSSTTEDKNPAYDNSATSDNNAASITSTTQLVESENSTSEVNSSNIQQSLGQDNPLLSLAYNNPQITGEFNQLIFDTSNTNAYTQIRALLEQLDSDFYVANFDKVTLSLDLVQEEDGVHSFKYQDIFKLFEYKDHHWDLVLITRILNCFSVFLLATLGFAFSKSHARSNKSLNLVFGISFFFAYFLILNSLTSVVDKGGNVRLLFALFIAINLIYTLLIYLLLSNNPRIKTSKAVIKLRNFMGVA